MPSNESDPNARLTAHLERWGTDHLHGKMSAVVKFGKPTGPVRLDEFVSPRLTFQYAVNDLTGTLLEGLRESLWYEAAEVSRVEMPKGEARREFRDRAERVLKRYVDGFKGAIAKLRSATESRWDEYERPFSEDEMEAFTKTFDAQAKELRQESVSAFMVTAPNVTAALQPTLPVSDRSRARRKLIKQYLTRHDERLTMADLGRRAAMSVTAIEGMVRGDRTRYAEDTLLRLLKTIGVPPQDW